MQELKIDGQFLEKEEVATRRRKGPRLSAKSLLLEVRIGKNLRLKLSKT
tara:strand:+ start:265 stop:411 length:147 start_codon:yes stop_codon:yes gene_type:complete